MALFPSRHVLYNSECYTPGRVDKHEEKYAAWTSVIVFCFNKNIHLFRFCFVIDTE